MNARTPMHSPDTRGSPRHEVAGWAARVLALIAAGLLVLLMLFWGDPAAAQPDFEADPAQAHAEYFTENAYTGTASCLECHEDEALDVITTGHFQWEGVTDRIVGAVGETHGKRDLINNFCIAVPTNEGRCTQCHAGYGYSDDAYDFAALENIDCLVCHDQTATYAKAPKTAGLPEPTVDLNLVAQSVAQNGGLPTRKACLGCHAKAGGGDNVKHGDLSTDLIATTREFDVHMGVDGQDMLCVDCHASKTGDAFDHGIAGMSLHSTDEGDMKQCGDCHGAIDVIHQGTSVRVITNRQRGDHSRLACQVCHVPAIARAIPTKIAWYWSDAGQDIDPIPIDPVTNKPLYDKMKGTFVWAKNLRPVLRFSAGLWERMMVNDGDTFSTSPVPLATPIGDANAGMIYPFKRMIGNQPADALENRILVPHLFGMQNGDNPYWGVYDWNLALLDGSAYTGQPYSGQFFFPNTEMLLSVNHEVPPAQQALGMDGDCTDCHNGTAVDWVALGWSGDPEEGGVRIPIGDVLYADGFEAFAVR